MAAGLNEMSVILLGIAWPGELKKPGGVTETSPVRRAKFGAVRV